MKNINTVFEKWKRGKGKFTPDQETLLKAYEHVVSDMSAKNVFNTTQYFELAYNNLKLSN